MVNSPEESERPKDVTENMNERKTLTTHVFLGSCLRVEYDFVRLCSLLDSCEVQPYSYYYIRGMWGVIEGGYEKKDHCDYLSFFHTQTHTLILIFICFDNSFSGAQGELL